MFAAQRCRSAQPPHSFLPFLSFPFRSFSCLLLSLFISRKTTGESLKMASNESFPEFLDFSPYLFRPKVHSGVQTFRSIFFLISIGFVFLISSTKQMFFFISFFSAYRVENGTRDLSSYFLSSRFSSLVPRRIK